MIEELLAITPYQFVQMEHKGKVYWGLEKVQEANHVISSFHRFVICAEHFTFKQLKQIQYMAIQQNESAEVRYWIYEAIVASQNKVIHG